VPQQRQGPGPLAVAGSAQLAQLLLQLGVVGLQSFVLFPQRLQTLLIFALEDVGQLA